MNTVTDINSTLAPTSYASIVSFREDAHKTVQTKRNYQLHLIEIDPGDEIEANFELVLRRTEAFTLIRSQMRELQRPSYITHGCLYCTFSYHVVKKHIYSVS